MNIIDRILLGKKLDADVLQADRSRHGAMPPYQVYFRLLSLPLSKIARIYCQRRFNKSCRDYCIDLVPGTVIGDGLYIGHPYGITVSDGTRIGRNCHLHKGVTLGADIRGSRKGHPVVGDRVWIGIHATVVGAVKIGDDVLIAPNSFVNCDVPSHSIVLGNPCRIIHREDATKGYIAP